MSITKLKFVKMLQLFWISFSISLILLLITSSCQVNQESGASYQELYRPQFHYTPERNWMNDPNGMFYSEGEYHLFYQYNPFGDKWGHMSWGHAISPDMVHWKHFPVALQEEDGIMIFSGSAVVDWKNTSGFGRNGNPPIVAIYTGRRNADERQFQCIAYSNDRGRTWMKYAGNPVIDIDSGHFRDPKVFWHAPGERWIMVVALSADHLIRFYTSSDLKHWSHLSDFGPAGSVKGLWECPDLFPLAVDGDPDRIKWVLEVDLGSGSVAGGSGGQYFIGMFDGYTFRVDEKLFENIPVEAEIPEGVIFADFEGEDYSGWTVTGEAFGVSPAKGTLANQNPVSGYVGSGLVNSFLNGDESQGTLTSPEFKITKDYINFLIGGGHHPGQTCMNLIVSGKVVRTTTGDDSESLEWHDWNVSDLKGQTANLEIVDQHSGGWGHTNIDHIMFSDKEAQTLPEQALWVDYGKDFYAAVSWSDIPKADGRRLWLGWMSNWQYAQNIPTSPWRGAQSIPRKLELKTLPEGIRLVQTPVKELQSLRGEHYRISDKAIPESNQFIMSQNVSGNMLEIVAKFDLGEALEVGLKVRKGDDEATIIGYDVTQKMLFVDRTHSGKVDFHEQFPGVHSAPLEAQGNRVEMHIFVDWSSIEVFGNQGKIVITDLVFPSPDSNGLEIYTKGGNAMIRSLDIWKLKSSWK